jgi:DNA-directed RNA polymerase subunit RPC12/RpoP
MPRPIKQSNKHADPHACTKCGSRDVHHHRVDAKRFTWCERIPCRCGAVATAWFRTQSHTKVLKRAFGFDQQGFMTELARELIRHDVHSDSEEEVTECERCRDRYLAEGSEPEFDPLDVDTDVESRTLECRTCGHVGVDSLFGGRPTSPPRGWRTEQ